MFSGSVRGAAGSANPYKHPIRRGLVPGRGGGHLLEFKKLGTPHTQSENPVF